MKSEHSLPAFPRYPSAAHKNQQARINVYYAEKGIRKSYYLGEFGTPKSHAIYSVVQLWYNTHNGLVLDRGLAEREADAIINSDKFCPDGYAKPAHESVLLPTVLKFAGNAAAVTAVFLAGGYFGFAAVSDLGDRVGPATQVQEDANDVMQQLAARELDPIFSVFMRKVETGLEWRDGMNRKKRSQQIMENYKKRREMRELEAATSTDSKS